MDNSLVKHNPNFLDVGLWMQSQRRKGEVGVSVQIGDFLYRAGYKVPDKVDALFLLYFLLRSQDEGYKHQIELSRYEILGACGLSDMGPNYVRLEDSLKRWSNITMEFSGCFFDGKEYISMTFGIIDDYKIRKEDRKVDIKFNDNWLFVIEQSNFCKYIDFNYYKALKRPVSRRLFEYLCPKFKGKDTILRKLVGLGKKLGLSGRRIKKDGKEEEVIFASKVWEKIKPAINEINKLSYNQKLLESLNIKPKDVLRIEYKFKGEGNDRIIIFTKKDVIFNKPTNEKNEDKAPQKPSAKTPKEPLPVPTSENPRWKEAIAWLQSIPTFHPDRIEDIKNLPEEEVALIYPYIRGKYEKGKYKEGRIFKAFKSRWYLGEAKEAIEAEKRKEAEKAKGKEIEKIREKKEKKAQSLYDRINAVIEKHGGRDKALYQGCEIVAFNHDFIAIKQGKERESFNLDEVEIDGFSSPKGRKE